MIPHSCISRRRQVSGSGGLVALVLISLLAPNGRAGAASPISIAGAPVTSPVSDADRMIAYRHGERMWQTSDGGTHLMVNQGSVAPAETSLQLYSSYDGGRTWSGGTWFNGTDEFSTGDGALAGNVLDIVYSSVGGQIAYAQLSYNPGSRTWTTITTETVFADPGAVAVNPAMAIDKQGGRWCAFVTTDSATTATSIRLASRIVGATAWSDTGVVFGPTQFGAGPIERSARPVAIAGGVGMVYTVSDEMFWATRSDDQPVSAPWTNQILMVGAVPPDSDPYASHFSIAADSNKNLHLAVVDNGALYYLRYNGKTRVWAAPRALTQDIRAAYPQVTVSGDTVALLVNTQSFGGVLQSTNAGGSFTFSHLLTHAAPPAGSGLNYGNPRFESPGTSTSPMPVLQQYVDGTTQRLLFFPVPLLTKSAPAKR